MEDSHFLIARDEAPMFPVFQQDSLWYHPYIANTLWIIAYSPDQWTVNTAAA